MSLGGLLLADNERILLSRLLGPGDIHPDQPLFYYLAFAIVALGFLIAITGLFGCWAACLFNRCITIFVREKDLYIIFFKFNNLIILYTCLIIFCIFANIARQCFCIFLLFCSIIFNI